jgi:beta-glucanase (GH16 family)
MKNTLLLAIGLSLLAGCKINDAREATTIPQAAREAGFTLQWEDDFTTFNEQYWTVGLQDEDSGDLVPGAAGRHLLNHQYDGYYTADNVYTEDGHLVLRNQQEEVVGVSPEGTFAYSSGWVMSMHKVFFQEGYLEVRAQFPSGAKVWPAIWLIPEDLSWCPEWDLFEYFGYRGDRGYDLMGMHLCYGPWPDQQWADHFIAGFDDQYDCEQWHVYGFCWTSSYAAWYIDGQEVRRLDAAGIPDWPAKDMYIVLNNGTRTESPEGDTTWPNELRVDYIRLFTK